MVDLKAVWRFGGWKGNFEDNILREIGNGREINLWEDIWVRNEAFKDKFSRLFPICSRREAKLRQGGE